MRFERLAPWLLAVPAAWLLLRYLLPWLSPFIISMGLAAAAEPAVNALCRRSWPRAAASGVCTLVILGVAAAAVLLVLSRGVVEISAIAAAMPEFLERLGDALAALEERILTYAAGAPESAAAFIRTALEAVSEKLYSLPGALSERLLELVGRLARATPSILLFSVTAGIGVYFFSASWPEIRASLKKALPRRFRKSAGDAGRGVRSAAGRLIKAQLILLLMTFAELLTALLLLGVRGAVTVAALTALVDALPVLGSGTVLLPWALYAFLFGDAALGAGLLVTYIIVTVLRSCVQPKLVGDQIGLHPVLSLMALYVGWCAAGVWGMLLFPLAAVAARQLWSSGLLRRKKEEEIA